MTTQKSKGYGFVSFIDKTEAQTAIDQVKQKYSYLQFLRALAVATNRYLKARSFTTSTFYTDK